MAHLTAKVGDIVSFKSDVEQSARVIEVRKGRDLMGRPQIVYVVQAPADGFSGHYIGRSDTAIIDASDCWDES